MPKKYDKNVFNPKYFQWEHWLNEEQERAFECYKQNDIIFLIGPAGTGKCQSLDSIVYTPDGPRTMGQIEVGDFVSTPDGKTAKVIKTFPQGKKDIYKITFADGDSVECCKEHLWRVDNQSCDWEGRTVDTSYIIHHLKSPNGRRKLSIKTPKLAHFNPQTLPINPYLLGLLLGDGCFSQNARNISFASADDQLITEINNALSKGYICKQNKTKNRPPIYYTIIGKNDKINYRKILIELNLWGCHAWEKFIPKNYIYNSFENRLAILQGLLDTDGTVDKKTGLPSFCSTSLQLASDVKELIQSIGGICTIAERHTKYKYKGIVKNGRTSYICHIRLNDSKQLFRLKRKKDLVVNRTKYFTKRIIKSVEYIGQKEAKCILIDHPDHLYLTNNFIVTHNTHLAIAFAIRDILQKERNRLILSRPVVEAGEHLGFLPGDMDEKVYPYMLPLYDCLEKICGRDSENRRYIDERYELAPLAFLRGRAQPLDATIMTPLGPKPMGGIVIGSNIIGANGKPCQVTAIYPQGFKKVYKITFSDGTWTECCDEHLWLTQTLSEKRHNKPYSVKTLSQIKECVTNGHQKNHRIPVAKPAQFDYQEVPMNPYLLGLLLGDGNLHKSACVSFSTKDVELVEAISNILPPEIKIVYSSKYDWRLTSGKTKKNQIKEHLRQMKLLGTKSENKFVPIAYKFNDINTRLTILRGLMDTDGTVYMDRKTSRVQFSSTSELLAKDVVFLVQSLGGVAYIRKREFDENDTHEHKGKKIIHARPCWIVDIVMETNPFSLKRKADKFSPRTPVRLIASVDLIDEKECQCIKVNTDDELYLTDNFIVTHNTFDGSVCILDEAQNCTVGQLKLFLTRLGKFSKMIVTGDPTQTDLPWDQSGLMHVVSKTKGVPGVGIVEFSERAIVRHPLVAEIVKRL